MFHNPGYPHANLLFIYFWSMLGQMHLDLDQEAKLRRMVAGGFTLDGIAGHLGISHHKAKLLVQWYGLRKKAPRPPRKRTRDVELRDMLLPGGDMYRCTTGANDRYLAALHREHPDRCP